MKRILSWDATFIYSQGFPAQHLDLLNIVPNEIVLKILGNASISAFYSFRSTNKKWSQLLSKEESLRYLFPVYFQGHPLPNQALSFPSFKESFVLFRNLTQGCYESTAVRVGQKRNTQLFMRNQTLIACALEEGAISLWNNKENLKSIKVASSKISCAYAQGKVFIAGVDGVYGIDLQEEKCECYYRLPSTKDWIDSITVQQDRLLVRYHGGEGDDAIPKHLVIIDFSTKSACLRILSLAQVGHRENARPTFGGDESYAVHQLALCNLLLSVTNEGSLEIVDLERGLITHRHFEDDKVTSLAWVKNQLILGFHSGCLGSVETQGELSVEKISSAPCTLHQGNTCSEVENIFSVDDVKVISVSRNSLIGLWEFKSTALSLSTTLSEWSEEGSQTRNRPVLYAEGKLYMGAQTSSEKKADPGCVVILDFNAANRGLPNIRDLLASGLGKLEEQGRMRFERLPESIQAKIFSELRKIFTQLGETDEGLWNKVSPAHQAEAIRNYLLTEG